MLSLKAKFQALITRLNQQDPKEPTLMGIARVLLWKILHFKFKMQII